jgi:PAS domain S-box-containing protein
MSRTPNILIVDDMESSREVMHEILLGQGYELLFATGGAEALRMTSAHTPDLILLDLMMPDIDGLAVCRTLRADPHTAQVPVIIVTALDDRAARLAGIAAGCDDFVTKPFDRIELRLRVRTIVTLNRYRLLLNEQQRFERLFTLSPNGLLIVNADGSINLANPAMARMVTVAAPEDLVGQRLPELLDPADRHACSLWLARLMAEQTLISQLSASLIGHDGLHRPVELDGSWFEAADAPAAQIVVRDISDRLKADLLEEDRRQLAFDLHDEVAQTATAIFRQLEQLHHNHLPRRPAARAALERAIELSRRLIGETRHLLAGLRPAALDDLGLVAALRIHADALSIDGITVKLHESLGARRLPAPVEIALFRIAQEALTNVRKHSGTSSAELQLSWHDSLIRLCVEDHGCGLATTTTPAMVGQRLGLRTMQDRAALLGGHVTITSQPGRGTRIVAELPLSEGYHDGVAW